MLNETLPSGWTSTTLGSVADFVNGDRSSNYPTQSDRVASGVPFINTGHIEPNGRLTTTGMDYISRESFNRLRAGKVRVGDIVYCLRGSTIGKTARNHFDEGAIASSLVIIRANEQACQDYLYFYLTSPLGQTLVAQHDNGSAQPNLSVRILSNYPLQLPPISEQRAIVHILGTLDDKIEIIRRMNETIETMSCALFKSWFVDFDPVRAKMDGRWRRGESSPGLPAYLYDLFPDRLVDSELGEIPEGWEIGSFGSISSQRTERVGTREVVVLSAVASGNLVRSDDHFNKRVYSKETNKYLLVEQWDFAYNPSRINIGSIGMLEDDLVGGVSPVYVVIRPRAAYRWFLEFSLRTSQTKSWINTLASGSVRQSLSYADFSSIPCVVPPEYLVEEFNRSWAISRNDIHARTAESCSLSKLRDTLIPELISGSLRIQDVERIAGAAV